jgi:formylglycine-generating enzyme required for sulfatase activity
MTDRQRLGLPEHYLADRLAASSAELFNELRQLSTLDLLNIIQSASSSLEQRIVAGNVLAVIGDPRLNTLDPQMMDIPAAEALIGLPEAELPEVMQRLDQLGLAVDWIRKECPQHPVQLKAYRIGKYPVTNQEYRDFLLDSHYPEIPTSWAFCRFPVERANHPVYTLSATACDAYAVWLAAKTGRSFRLPSESEWEYAAAGPQQLEFPWGAAFDPNLANTCETGLFNTSSVGVFVGGDSVFAVCDMAGNVEEYVADIYRPYPDGPMIEDHLSQIHGSYRLARGGCFARFRDLARTRRRHGHNPRSVAYAMGFRLAESL